MAISIKQFEAEYRKKYTREEHITKLMTIFKLSRQDAKRQADQLVADACEVAIALGKVDPDLK